jgi:hypothetical protein
VSLDVEDPPVTIESIRRDQIKACKAAVEEALAIHRCKLVGVPVFVMDRSGAWQIATQVEILSQE